MAGKVFQVYTNDVIDATFTNIRGDTEAYANAGERRLGSTDYLSVTKADVDGTTPSMPAEDELISSTLMCALCGRVPKSVDDMIEQRGFLVCSKCVDESEE